MLVPPHKLLQVVVYILKNKNQLLDLRLEDYLLQSTIISATEEKLDELLDDVWVA